MNKLIPIKAIGSPWHGRTLNDVYEFGPFPYPTIATRPAGATWGPAIPIHHPNAHTGPKLSAGTDRTWGQYIGHSRSINGADSGTGIGWERWLYCDPSTDATWLMRAEFTVTGTGVDIEVWCDGVFGRFRPDDPYTNTPRLVNSFTWTPDLPSWNVWGYTVANVMAQIQAPSGHGNLSISRDGSTVWIHFFTTTNANIAMNLYGPTNQIPNFLGLSSGIALAGIAKVVVAGTNEASEGGAALTATITKDVIYEGGASVALCSTYTRNAAQYQHTAKFYRTEDGDLSRTYNYTVATGAFTVQYNLWGQTWNESGLHVSIYGGGCENKVYAQNAVYVASYKQAGGGGSPYTFQQKWFGLDYLGVDSQLYTKTSSHTYAATSSAQHEMPYTRKWVGTFSPHNPVGTFEIYDAVYLTPYTGTVYQYI